MKKNIKSFKDIYHSQPVDNVYFNAKDVCDVLGLKCGEKFISSIVKVVVVSPYLNGVNKYSFDRDGVYAMIDYAVANNGYKDGDKFKSWVDKAVFADSSIKSLTEGIRTLEYQNDLWYNATDLHKHLTDMNKQLCEINELTDELGDTINKRIR